MAAVLILNITQFYYSTPFCSLYSEQIVMLPISQKTETITAQVTVSHKYGISYTRLHLCSFWQMVSLILASPWGWLIFSSFQGDMKPSREFKLQSEGLLTLSSFYYFMLPLENKTYPTFSLICFRYLLRRRKKLKFRNPLTRKTWNRIGMRVYPTWICSCKFYWGWGCEGESRDGERVRGRWAYRKAPTWEKRKLGRTKCQYWCFTILLSFGLECERLLRKKKKEKKQGIALQKKKSKGRKVKRMTMLNIIY